MGGRRGGQAALGRKGAPPARRGAEGGQGPPQGPGLGGGSGLVLSLAPSRLFRFPLTCPWGRWSFLSPRSTALCGSAKRPNRRVHRRWAHCGFPPFCLHARARLTLRTARLRAYGPRCPGARVTRTVEGVCCRFRLGMCGAGERDRQHLCPAAWREHSPPPARAAGGSSPRPPPPPPRPPTRRELTAAGPGMPRMKRTPWRQQ